MTCLAPEGNVSIDARSAARAPQQCLSQKSTTQRRRLSSMLSDLGSQLGLSDQYGRSWVLVADSKARHFTRANQLLVSARSKFGCVCGLPTDCTGQCRAFLQPRNLLHYIYGMCKSLYGACVISIHHSELRIPGHGKSHYHMF